MNSLESFKTQLLTVASINNKDSSNAGIYSMIFSFLAITIIEHIFKFIPKLISYIDVIVQKCIKKAEDKISNSTTNYLNIKEKENTAIINFKKIFKKDDNNNHQNKLITIDETPDAILDLVSSNNNAISLENRDGIYIVNHYKEINLSEDVSFISTQIKKDNDVLSEIQFSLYSKNLSLSQLLSYTKHVTENYIIKKQNKLGDKLFYFNEIIKPVPLDSRGNIIYRTCPDRISFNITEFKTNKNFSNIFGEDIQTIIDRVNFFINNKKWYENKGIPYTLGILLHGVGGCGKTSIIKAIASVTKRHIFNLSLNKSTTKTQLYNLFLNDKVSVESYGQSSIYRIPIENRIFVIEDCDCLTDVLHDREYKESLLKQSNSSENLNENKVGDSQQITNNKNIVDDDNYESPIPIAINKKQEDDEELNLSYILNLFDGILEQPNRIVILTSNRPEILDKAFRRPGRIDISLEFQKCSSTTICNILSNFYSTPIVDSFPHRQFTPAEIMQICFNHFNNIQGAIDTIKLGKII